MVSSTLVFFLSAIFILTAQAVARPDFLYRFCTLERGNYTASSTYGANLNDLLVSLSSTTKIDHGFYHSAFRQNSDQVYGIELCRGDVNADVFRGCLNNAASLLTQRCHQQKKAIGWYDKCMLRYSNRSLLGVMETLPGMITMGNPNNVSAKYVDQFIGDLSTLLESLRSRAAAGGPDLKFAAGNAIALNFQALHALVQCTRYLSELFCNNCLVGAFKNISLCCDGKVFMYSSGDAISGTKLEDFMDLGQWSKNPFSPLIPTSLGSTFSTFNGDGKVHTRRRAIGFSYINPTTAPTTAASLRRSTHITDHEREADDRKRSSIFVINIIFVLIASMVLSISLGVYFSVKRLIRNNDGPTNESTRIELESLHVDPGSEANKLGQGGYSWVYERYTQTRKKLSSMRKKKDGSNFVTPNIKEENEIQELTSDLPMPDGFSESNDNSVSQLLRKRLRSLRGLRHSMMSSLSSSSRSFQHMSQLISELDEYKRRCEKAERKVNQQREKISSVRKEMQEEVNSMKRQQAQQLQEMEAKQREMEQKIEFLLSRTTPTP
ncbi:cysteine-rich receptor-like protein kinase 29 isoform X2 [Alnus glutinosa]|uniref:cysteine-rich receptor-like protein kinase 29 isoform X2 n=1 Tax=Alnus glutinosa TaxID=3517 RepID=UPI002D7A098C|nr:cysteine-rich receptor-like protein kinase 29 isoform X2 [Alnus glutinosa]